MKLTILLVLGWLSASLPAQAQLSAQDVARQMIERSEVGGSERQEQAGAAESDITEVQVTGRKLFSTLEHQIRKADEVLYGIFNELNDDDYYDVHCGWESRPNTNIKYWECRPEFLRQATRAEALAFHNQVTGFSGGHAPPPQAVISYEYPRLAEKMREVLQESPELLDAVVKSYELRQELEEMRTDYWKDDAD